MFITSDPINTYISYHARLGKGTYILYWTLILMVVSALVGSRFVYLDISVRASGIIRPNSERTEIKPRQSGIIEALYFHENEKVPQNALILRLKNPNYTPKKLLNCEVNNFNTVFFLNYLLYLFFHYEIPISSFCFF